MRNKYGVIKLSILLGLALLLILLPTNPAWADPPAPPPTVWEKLDFSFPPPEAPSIAEDSIWPQAALKTFQAVADAEVRQSKPNDNYGIELTMGVGYDDYLEYSLIQRALLRFNTSTFLPPGTTVHQATLRVYVLDSGYCDVGSSQFRVHRITDNWSELTTTWNNQPSFAEGYGSAIIPVPPSPGWVSFDVTDLVQRWVDDSDSEYGLVIRGPETTPYLCAFRTFLTKGGGGYTAAPELDVNYTLPTPALSVSKNDIVIIHQCGVGAPDPAPQTVMVQNSGLNLNDWTASVTGGDGWLSLNKTSSKISHIFPDRLKISVSETATCPETVTAQIQISAPGLAGSPQTINVTLQQSTEPLNQVYLPVVIKNSSGVGSTGSNGVVNTASATGSKKIALLIGIADFQYLEPPTTFTALRSGVWGDDVLMTLGDEFETQLALEPDYETVYDLTEEQATLENISYGVQRLAEDATDEDVEGVLIYISDHGGSLGIDFPPLDEIDHKDEMLAAYDTNDDPAWVDYILDDNFKTQLNNIPTQNLGVVIDACNSGGMEVINSNRAVLAASQEDEYSIESSYLEHGVFTYYLHKARLDGANSDTNGDGWLSIQEIYDYAYTPVANYTSGSQHLALDVTKDFTVTRISTMSATGVMRQ